MTFTPINQRSANGGRPYSVPLLDEERKFIMTDGASDQYRYGDSCPNAWFGSHKYEARYDLGPANLKVESISGTGSGQFLERFRSQTYVRDICVKCGNVIERKR